MKYAIDNGIAVVRRSFNYKEYSSYYLSYIHHAGHNQRRAAADRRRNRGDLTGDKAAWTLDKSCPWHLYARKRKGQDWEISLEGKHAPIAHNHGREDPSSYGVVRNRTWNAEVIDLVVDQYQNQDATAQNVVRTVKSRSPAVLMQDTDIYHIVYRQRLGARFKLRRQKLFYRK